MKAKEILRHIWRGLSLALALAVFIILVLSLGTGASIIIALIGKMIGIGKDIFIYIVLFVCIDKAWDALAWVVGKIAEREEQKKEKQYFERRKL